MVYKARWDGENYRVWTKGDLDRWVRAMWINHDAAGYHYAQAQNESLSLGLRQYHSDRCSKTLAKMSRLIGGAKFNDEGMRRDFFRRTDGVLRMTDDQRFVMGDGPVGVLASFGEDGE